MIKTGIIGAGGRMGQRNALAVHHSTNLELVGVVEKKGHAGIGRPYREIVGDDTISLTLGANPAEMCRAAEVIVDFTQPAATLALLKEAKKNQTDLVIGTTGFSPAQMKEINKAGKEISIVLSGNFSTGINLLLGLVKKAAETLSAEYDIEVMEQHHNQKIDAPSGSAIMLGQAAALGRGLDFDKVMVTGRKGQVGRRPTEEIGVSALRGGGVVGQHSVYFMGPNDKVELTHTALNRQAFASGVVTACKWIKGHQPGLYDMLDVLGLK